MIHHDRLRAYYFFEHLFLGYMRTPCFGMTKYFPVVNPKKNCLNKNDYFEAEIGIGAYYGRFKEVELTINGKPVEFDVEKGVAHFKHKPTVNGTNELNIQCQIVNPISGEKWLTSSSFEYEVQ